MQFKQRQIVCVRERSINECSTISSAIDHSEHFKKYVTNTKFDSNYQMTADRWFIDGFNYIEFQNFRASFHGLLLASSGATSPED
ncbi:MAG: hypothetical protein Q9194_007354 [Teloschistes cf. exilis]